MKIELTDPFGVRVGTAEIEWTEQAQQLGTESQLGEILDWTEYHLMLPTRNQALPMTIKVTW